MPSTLPSHPAAVLGLKLWRPRRFDGVALTAGAASPDVAYLLDGSGLPVWPYSHEWIGLVGWCLPVSAVLVLVLRAAAPTVAAHLPAAGVLALRDYGALGRVRHPWWVTASSIVLGGASHLVLDDLTNLHDIVDVAVELTGMLTALLLAIHIGANRLIRRWHGPPPTVATRPMLFWGAAAFVAVPGTASVVVLPAALLVHTTGVRLITMVFLALLAGAAAVGLRSGGVSVEALGGQGRMEP